MKIAIIGTGTGAIITALSLIKCNHSVDFYFDPKISPLKIGESSTPHFLSLLNEVCGVTLDELIKSGVATRKDGVNFIGWGKTHNWIHPFDNHPAIHFDTTLFNDYIHRILKQNHDVNYFPTKVLDTDYIFDKISVHIHGKAYDFVVECSGWYGDGGYIKSHLETVNAAILFTKDSVEKQNYTVHRATYRGWQFELPFGSQSKCGSLFNHHIDPTSEETIRWVPRYARNLLRHRSVAMNGNKLFFFEPLQALSLLYYQMCAELICNYLKNRTKLTLAETNFTYRKLIEDYHKTLALHYRFGSVYDTPFWRDIKKRSNEYALSDINTGDIDTLIQNVAIDRDFYENFNTESSYSAIGTIKYQDHIHIIKNMLAIEL